MEFSQRFRNFDQVWDLYRFFLKKVIRSKVMVGSCSKQTELLVDFYEIMKGENLSVEQKRVEFLKLTLFLEKILQILGHVFDYLF